MNELIQLLEKFPDKEWNWDELSYNPNITIEIVEKYPDKEWNWTEISNNIKLTIEFIEKFHEKPLDWQDVYNYSDLITIEFIDKYPNKEWNWADISWFKSITKRNTVPLQLLGYRLIVFRLPKFHSSLKACRHGRTPWKRMTRTSQE